MIPTSCHHSGNWTQSLSRVILVLSIFVALLLQYAVVEAVDDDEVDNNNNNYDEGEDVFDDDTYNRKASNGSDDDAWYMVLIFSLLFGLFLTFFRAFLGYFSFMEDNLMRRYLREGETIVARVVTSDFVRGGGGQVLVWFTHTHNTHGRPYPRDNSEYMCICEYDRKLAEYYTVRIRKQCKAKAWDFLSNPKPGTEGMLLSIKSVTPIQPEITTTASQEERLIELTKHEEGATVCCGDDEELWGVEPHYNELPHRHFLEMLILPTHDRSAYPKKAIERICSTRYRLSTLGLIVFDLALAAFSTCWAIKEVMSLDGDRRIVGSYVVIAFLVLVVLEVPLIHCCCHALLLDALREEYLDNGDYIPLQDDASSLSSGSDRYLSMTGRSKTSFASSFL